MATGVVKTTDSFFYNYRDHGSSQKDYYCSVNISEMKSALLQKLPQHYAITKLVLNVSAKYHCEWSANTFIEFGFGDGSSISKTLQSEDKVGDKTQKDGSESYSVDITTYLQSKTGADILSSYGSYLTFRMQSDNVMFKQFTIESVTLTVTYDDVAHSYSTETSRTPATCLASGSVVKQCSCGETQTTTLAQLSHSYTGAIKNDSNSKTGTHSYKCVNGCNQYGGAKTHTWNSGTQTTAPTCTANGVKTYTCTTSGCGGTYTESIPALGHSWGTTTYTWSADGKTCTAKRVCSRCGTTETATATITTKVKTPATCTAKGTTTYTATFSVSWATTQTKDVQDISIVNHTEVTIPAVAPTCTETGKTEGKKCSVCGTVTISQTTVSALGHDYKSVVTQPTETSEGYTTHTCSRCGDSYVNSYTCLVTVKANNNSYGTVTGGKTCNKGETTTITATPNEDYTFVSWNDGVISASRNITVTSSVTYTAYFKLNAVYIDISQSAGVLVDTEEADEIYVDTIKAYG